MLPLCVIDNITDFLVRTRYKPHHVFPRKYYNFLWNRREFVEFLVEEWKKDKKIIRLSAMRLFPEYFNWMFENHPDKILPKSILNNIKYLDKYINTYPHYISDYEWSRLLCNDSVNEVIKDPAVKYLSKNRKNIAKHFLCHCDIKDERLIYIFMYLIDQESLNANPHAVNFLLRNPTFICWAKVENPAMFDHLTEEDIKNHWDIFSESNTNPKAIEYIENKILNENWSYDSYVRFNPMSRGFLERYPEYDICVVDVTKLNREELNNLLDDESFTFTPSIVEAISVELLSEENLRNLSIVISSNAELHKFLDKIPANKIHWIFVFFKCCDEEILKKYIKYIYPYYIGFVRDLQENGSIHSLAVPSNKIWYSRFLRNPDANHLNFGRLFSYDRNLPIWFIKKYREKLYMDKIARFNNNIVEIDLKKMRRQKNMYSTIIDKITKQF